MPYNLRCLSLALLSCACLLSDISFAQAEELADLRKLLTKHTFENEAGNSMPYRLFVPKDYDAEKKYPIILFLHGRGENGRDNIRTLKNAAPLRFVSAEVQADHPCLLVAPQNPRGLWPGKSALLALEILDSLEKEFSIDTNRRYVTGLSSGGMGTYFCLMNRPKHFAAAVPICGSGNVAKAETIAHIPVWGFCGDKDGFKFHEKMRAITAAVKTAGGDWKYTEYPDVGHNSWDRAYATKELPAWLFAQSISHADD